MIKYVGLILKIGDISSHIPSHQIIGKLMMTNQGLLCASEHGGPQLSWWIIIIIVRMINYGKRT